MSAKTDDVQAVILACTQGNVCQENSHGKKSQIKEEIIAFLLCVFSYLFFINCINK